MSVISPTHSANDIFLASILGYSILLLICGNTTTNNMLPKYINSEFESENLSIYGVYFYQ